MGRPALSTIALRLPLQNSINLPVINYTDHIGIHLFCEMTDDEYSIRFRTNWPVASIRNMKTST